MTTENPKKSTSTALAPYKPTPLALPMNVTGSIEAFIRAANAAPILSPERERELAVRLRDEGDMEAAGELITSHLRLVISIARQYLGYGLPFPDLIQEGNVGLMKAVKHFDPDHGARLVTFAMTWIRAEIQEYIIRNWKLVKVATTKSQRKIFFKLRSMKESTDLLTLDQSNQIAEALEVKPQEVIEMDKRLFSPDVTIDEPSSEHEGSVSPEDWLHSEDDEPINQIAADRYEQVLGSELPKALESLDPRSRRVIEARWFYDESQGQKGATLSDLAKELGVSQERVRQIEKRAMLKLKEILKAEE